MKEKKLSSQLEYECSFMKLYRDKVELPDGGTSERIYVKHNGGAAVLPITKEGNLLLIKQFRYPVGLELIEIPAGKKDFKEETGLACVKREIEEETGYNSNRFEYIGLTHNCVGYSSEDIELFIAYDCYKVDNPKAADDDEFIEPMMVTPEEAKELINQNKITDAKSWIVIMKYLENLRNG